MIEPALTSSPPNAFTPSILGLESRPFRVEPPPFFCAMLTYSSGCDRRDLQFGEILTVTLALLVVLATTHLEDVNLVVPTMCQNRDCDRCAGNQGSANLDLAAVADCQNLIKHDLLTHIRSNLFYFNFFASSNTILFATGFYDRVHMNLLKNFHEWNLGRRNSTKPNILA